MNQNPTPDQVPQTQPPSTVKVAMPNMKPYATYFILGVTTFVYLLQLAGQYRLITDVVALGVKDDTLIRAGELWRLITPVFLHASILHIAFNMYALFIFGRGIEVRYGHGRFLLLYFLSGYAGNVMSFLLTVNPSLGASTAIFGLIAAEGVFIIQNRKLLGDRVNRSLMNLLYIAGVNLLIGFTTSGVDNWGHIGGLLGGFLFAWFGGPRWKLEGFYPSVKLIDEREGHGAFAGTVSVLLFFIPLTALGWIWVLGK
ncbi:MAG: rhomboid family intramembrane serine protease [Anaerolineales bacterium]